MATYSQIVNNRDANRTQNFTYDALNRIQTARSSGPNWGESFGSATAPGGVPSTPGIDAWGNLWHCWETASEQHKKLPNNHSAWATGMNCGIEVGLPRMFSAM